MGQSRLTPIFWLGGAGWVVVPMSETRKGNRKKSKFWGQKLTSFDSGKGGQRNTCGIGVLASTDHGVLGPEAGLPQSVGSLGCGK